MIYFSLFSNTGNREINEDAVGATANNNNACFVLCDGLGGHGMGDVASQIVKENVLSLFDKVCEPNNLISTMLEDSQQKLMNEQKLRNAEQRMKTTASVLILLNNKTIAGHIGDSRLYAFSDNKIVFRSRDHSVPQMLALSGEIKESDIRNHPDRNVLLRAMGVPWEQPMYEINDISSCFCDAFLLCSDGFWELIEETEMCALLRRARDVSEWLDMMKSVVEINGIGKNMDNYSAIAVWNK